MIAEAIAQFRGYVAARLIGLDLLGSVSVVGHLYA